MAGYTLYDAGYKTFKQIKQARMVVGRVTTHAAGGYVGIIGTLSHRADTEKTAFEGVAAKALGYSSAEALKASNAAIRRKRAKQTAAARHVVGEMLHGNFKPFDAMIDAENARMSKGHKP